MLLTELLEIVISKCCWCTRLGNTYVVTNAWDLLMGISVHKLLINVPIKDSLLLMNSKKCGEHHWIKYKWELYYQNSLTFCTKKKSLTFSDPCCTCKTCTWPLASYELSDLTTSSKVYHDNVVILLLTILYKFTLTPMGQQSNAMFFSIDITNLGTPWQKSSICTCSIGPLRHWMLYLAKKWTILHCIVQSRTIVEVHYSLKYNCIMHRDFCPRLYQ